MAEIMTGRDIVLLAFFLLARDGIPWFMQTVFPSWFGEKARAREAADKAADDFRKTTAAIQLQELQYRQGREEREFEFEKELKQKDLALRRELADRDAAAEARNFKLMETMEKQISRLTEVVGANTMQLSVVGAAVAGMQKGQEDYFKKGEKAIKQVVELSKKAR